MGKIYTALGLMSGTSMDGVDASIVSSIDGIQYDEKFNQYYEYDTELYKNLSNTRDKIFTSVDLKKLSKELKMLEKDITLFHAKVVNDLINSAKRSQISSPEIIGFHGQTIFHNPKERISIQLGNGKLLSQLSKKTVIYNFRKNDLMNGGQGAPLTPIFHKSLKEKIYGKNIPVIFINIGGITNVTCFNSMDKFDKSMFASDIGPGNCLIDEWVRNNTNEKYDKDGIIAKSGKINELILNQALDNFEGNLNSSLDIKDFDVSFARGLSLEDGASTITNFTAEIITTSLKNLLEKNKYDLDNHLLPNFIICGGGRKNKYLMDLLSAKISKKIGYKKFQLIDEHNVDGDFIESEAFAFLAIRSFLNLPISFPNTTGCKEPCTGGVMVKNY
jgi:anhydro-N-acetylmuramic acid kinase